MSIRRVGAEYREKHLRLAKTVTFVLVSFDPPRFGTGPSFTGRISLSRPVR